MAPMLIELEWGRGLFHLLEDFGSRYFGPVHRDLLLVDTNDIVPGMWQWFLFNGKDLDLDNFQDLFSMADVVHGESPPWAQNNYTTNSH
jgi:hypothetical protein